MTEASHIHFAWTKRVAAAVGDGTQVVVALHAFLAGASDKDALTINIGRQ